MARRIDKIGFKDFELIQDDELFCYGVDAVLLADFANALHTDTVLDMCTGNGVVPLIVEAKYSPRKITGIEVLLSSYLLAEENAKLNRLDEKIKFICADVKNIKEFISAESIDLVTCNPPYFESGRGIDCEVDEKHIARHETTANLQDFMAAAAYVLKKNGRLCMVHRPQRLADLFEYARQLKLEPKKLLLVTPHEGEAPNLALVEFVKGAGKQLNVLPSLAVRNKDGSFTDGINEIYNK